MQRIPDISNEFKKLENIARIKNNSKELKRIQESLKNANYS